MTGIPDQPREIRAVMQWPIFIGNSTDDDTFVQCDYCSEEFWCSYNGEGHDNFSSALDELYRAISKHRMDGCPHAPQSES